MTTVINTEFDEIWHLQYRKLVELKQKNGHCIVPQVYEQDRALGNWVNKQRINHTKKKMRQDRKELLDEIEFVWKVDMAMCRALRIAGRAFNEDKKWHLQYKKMVEFQQKNGNCIVPQGYKQDKSLGQWVSRQRRFHTSNKMQPDRKILLDEIGFVWKVDRLAARLSVDDKKWRKQYENLVAFKRQHEHCRVPNKYKEDVALGQWVSTQRTLHNTEKKTLPHREELLNEIGFVWKVELVDKIAARVSSEDKKWRHQYENLVAFKRQHEHCRVPNKYKEDVTLGQWVDTQRTLHNTKKKIIPYREELLNEIGFVWKVELVDKIAARVSGEDKKWRHQYEKLVAFKRQHEHCRVPNKYKEDVALGTWVSIQRKRYTNKKLRLDRKDLLDELRFVSNSHTFAAKRSATTDDDSDSEAFTSSVMGLPNDALGETEPAQGPASHRFECLSPASRKRSRSCLAESGQIAARTNQRDNATVSCSSVEEDAGRDEEDPRPPLVTSSTLIDSDPSQEVVPEEAPPDAYLPPNWTHIKLEPDW